MKKYYNRFPINMKYINNWFDVWNIAGGSIIKHTKPYIKLLFITNTGKEQYKINLKFLINKVNQEIRESNLVHYKSAKVNIKRLEPNKFEYDVPENKDFKVYMNYVKILKDIEDNEKEMDNSKTIN